MRFFSLLLFSFIKYIHPCNVLVLSGGGSYGAFSAGVLSNLLENNYTWDVITGVSAGAINAAYIAQIPRGDEKNHIPSFRQIWSDLKSSDIYTNELFFNHLSLFNTSPEKKKLQTIFMDRTLQQPLIISATSLTNGLGQLFSHGDIIDKNIVDLLMSSTAIPLIFPPYYYDSDFFVDGGISSNILLDEGINWCINRNKTSKINVDVIICSSSEINVDDSFKNPVVSFKQLITRLFTIISHQLEYFQLFNVIKRKDVFITVYEQKSPTNISFIDFDQGSILFDMGYTFSNVKKYNLFINK